MKCGMLIGMLDNVGRTPHGVRGLKSRITLLGAMVSGRTPHGVRGLKYDGEAERGAHDRRTPHGVRGLKWDRPDRDRDHGVVAPLTGCVD